MCVQKIFYYFLQKSFPVYTQRQKAEDNKSRDNNNNIVVYCECKEQKYRNMFERKGGLSMKAFLASIHNCWSLQVKKVLVVSDDGSVLATNVRIVNGRHFTPNLLAKLLYLCQESSHPLLLSRLLFLMFNKLKLDSRKS